MFDFLDKKLRLPHVLVRQPHYYLDIDSVKAGDVFTSISFFNTNDLSTQNKAGYLYRLYNRLTG